MKRGAYVTHPGAENITTQKHMGSVTAEFIKMPRGI